MGKDYPLQYKLDSGTHVEVNKMDNHLYDFKLTPKDGPERHFTLNDEEEYTDEKEKGLEFDELNALRRFWLITRNEE